LQQTEIFGTSPTYFQNRTPTSWTLNKNTLNKFLGTPLAASLASTYVIVGKNGFSQISSCYILIIDLTLVSNIVTLWCLRVLFRTQHNTTLDKKRQQTGKKLTHYWCLGTKGKKIVWEEGEENWSYLHYYRSWMGAPQSRDLYATYGRRKELQLIDRKASDMWKYRNFPRFHSLIRNPCHSLFMCVPYDCVGTNYVFVSWSISLYRI